MTTTDFDASKLEPGAPELEHGSDSAAKMILAYSQAVSLKRIADAMTANTEQHDRVEASMDAFIQREGDMLERIAVALERLTERLAAPAVTSTEPTPGADSEGWIPWHGGECPVTDGTAVDFRMRDGEEIFSVDYPTKLDWSHSGTVRGSRGGWEIVAYRIHND